MRRWITVIFVVVAAFLGIVGSAQSAPTIDAEFCSAAVDSASNWGSFGGFYGGMSFEDHCSTGDGLQILADAPQTGDGGGWALWTPPESPPLSYSFDIDGGDTSGGMTYGASSCWGCAPDVTFSSLSPGDPTTHAVVSSPAGSEGIFIYAQCELAPFCLPLSTPVRISNIVVAVSDSTPPTVTGTVNQLPANPGTFVGWTNKSTIPVSLDAYDGGFGVYLASASIEGAANPIYLRDFSGNCFLGFPLSVLPPCSSHSSGGGAADISSVADGIHDLTFYAEDALNNSATTGPAQIGIDRQAPPPPTSSTLDFNATGWPGQRWTSDPDVVMHWAMAPVPSDPELESPLTGQDLSVRREGSPTVTHTSIVPATNSFAKTLSTDGEWNFAVRYSDEAGNLGEPTIKSVGLDADAPLPPQDLNDVDWLSKAALSGQKRITWSAPEPSAELESGICGYVVSIDDSPGANPTFGEDDSTAGTSWSLPAGLPDGISYFHVRAVSCAGVSSETVTSEIRLDTEGPELSLSGITNPGAWTNSLQTATIGATDANSGVAKVGYSIDDGAIKWITDDHANAAIPEGGHRLTAYAVDVAGNSSSVQSDVRTDIHAPVVSIETASVDDPTRVSASAVDPDSGLVSASIELRRVDLGADAQERQWQATGGAEPITRGTTSVVGISRILDDASLPPGDYELRVNAVDMAGNSTTDSAFAIRSVRLPLRRAAEISAAVANIKVVCRTKSGKACDSVRKCSRKSRCRRVSIVDRNHAKSSVVQRWSRKSVLIGDALDPNGAPIVGAAIMISSAPFLHDSEPLGSAVTDSKGHYELRLGAGPSRKLTAQLGGSPIQQPATATATVNVRSEIKFSPRPRKFRSGKTLRLRGRVLHSQWQPVGGISVRFQWYSPNGWASFANPVQTDEHGKFALAYRWRKTNSKSTVRLRARIDRPTNWPFAPGSSKSAKLTVFAAR